MTEHLQSFLRNHLLKDLPGSSGGYITIVSSFEPFLFAKNQPMYCGIMLFTAQLMMNHIGEKLMVMLGTTLLVTHLYHSLRQGEYLKHKWPMIEALMTIYTPEQIFAGRPPKSLSAAVRQMNHMLDGNPDGGGFDWTVKRTVLVDIFQIKYVSGSSHSFTQANLQKIVRSGMKKGTRKTVQSIISSLSMVQCLSMLRPLLEKKSALTFPYFQLHDDCTKLCEAIHVSMHDRIRCCHQSYAATKKHEVVYISWRLLERAKENDHRWKQGMNEYLVDAAEVFERFLRGKNICR